MRNLDCDLNCPNYGIGYAYMVQGKNCNVQMSKSSVVKRSVVKNGQLVFLATELFG